MCWGRVCDQGVSPVHDPAADGRGDVICSVCNRRCEADVNMGNLLAAVIMGENVNSQELAIHAPSEAG
jgi:hypothetical protein